MQVRLQLREAAYTHWAAQLPEQRLTYARRQQALEAEGAAHPRPEAVTDALFRDSAFFDPNDLVQIKYEMLRSVE